jgi:hypothetical protein
MNHNISEFVKERSLKITVLKLEINPRLQHHRIRHLEG